MVVVLVKRSLAEEEHKAETEPGTSDKESRKRKTDQISNSGEISDSNHFQTPLKVVKQNSLQSEGNTPGSAQESESFYKLVW